MGARRFTDLVAWSLATELARCVYGLTNSGPAARDFAFRDQLRGAAASAPANIAEGFGRFQHADFARFLRIAIGSLDEVENHLLHGIARGYYTLEHIEPLLTLKRRAAAASVGLIRHLKDTRTP